MSALELYPSSTEDTTTDRDISNEPRDQLLKWLSVCDRDHQGCGRKLYTSWYPTRLLDLGDSSYPQTHVRVVDGGLVKAPERYNTLSHRWWRADYFQLTKATFNTLKDGIHISILPKVYKDAISVSRELAIRYLWIDSLCIYQDEDDRSDWIQEAGKMNMVYEHAYCNLAATGSERSSEGLFFDRSPEFAHHEEVDLAFELLTKHSEPTRYAMLDRYYWEKELIWRPLNRRGWVLQERLLARRVLHFGRNQIIWECSETTASEAYPSGVPPKLFEFDDGLNLKPLNLEARSQHSNKTGYPNGVSDSEVYARNLWQRIVETYSNCQLTYGNDKLIAMSGIAKRMRTYIQDDYVVGMWRRYLASELLWIVRDHRQTRAQRYCAPSFSWASIDGPVLPGYPPNQGVLFSVNHVHIDHATNDDTGLVKGGYVLLKGALKKLGLYRISDAEASWMLEVNGCNMTERVGGGRVDESLQVYLDVDKPDFHADMEEGSLYCMPARRINNPSPDCVLCLLLKHLGNGDFIRLGLSTMSMDNNRAVILERHGNAPLMPCKSYNDQTGEHVFRLM